MGRRSHGRALNVWANGLYVGQWRLPARGAMEFQYDPTWLAAPEARPLSLSLPLSLDPLPLKGPSVEAYFDNLLPDSEAIRRRLQRRFRTASGEPFDLLEAIGRDCVGAVQLLPEGESPEGVLEIQAEPLDEDAIERLLVAAVSPTAFEPPAEQEELRISLAGAQEKTALLWYRNQWCRPHGATPTTHIFKLPLGLVGNRQADMRTSIENEWLCARILAAYGLPIANCAIQTFGQKKVLVVERFDRQLHATGDYWLRLPQEDFCQATATPSAFKYEADGGPGLAAMAQILHGSENRDGDLATLLRAQLLFWMLAATDGHGKNFSLRLLAGGRYRLTPLYDVLSTWPVIGTGANQLDWGKLRLALALRNKNPHYRLREIQRRHFNASAQRCGFGADMESLIEDILTKTPGVIEKVARALPAAFPEAVFESITQGLQASAERLQAMAPGSES